MADIMDYMSTWPALKWVVIVLVAGFIGQFGKMLAQVIVRKISLARQKKQSEPVVELLSTHKDQEEAAVNKENDTKLQKQYPDKKALKIAAKERKKSSKKNK